jgi:hypothetical protein
MSRKPSILPLNDNQWYLYWLFFSRKIFLILPIFWFAEKVMGNGVNNRQLCAIQASLMQ